MPVCTYKYRLFPNSTQAAGLTDMLGSFCDLYNACLQQRIERHISDEASRSATSIRPTS